MPTLATKPALAITASAAIVMGASGVSAAARAAQATSTTPSPMVGRPGPGGIGADATALATKLGVSVADLRAAIKAVRASSDDSTASDDRITEAKTVADDLGVSQATIQAVFDAETPTAREVHRGGPRPDGAPGGTTPQGDAPGGTTPPSGAPTGTTPQGGGGGRVGSTSDDASLVAALQRATGKDAASVTAALKRADAVRDAARKAREAEFAKKLAEQLHLDQDEVLNAVETSTPTPPARAARQATGQAG